MAGILAVAAAAPAAGRDAQGTTAETGRSGDVLKMLKENLEGKKLCIFALRVTEEDVFFCFWEGEKEVDTRFRWLVWYWKIMSYLQLYMDISFAPSRLSSCAPCLMYSLGFPLCVCFFKKMGSPNKSNVSALLGEWNLETSQCGGLLGFPGWANVGVPATPASLSCYQHVMRVASSEALPQSRADATLHSNCKDAYCIFLSS